MIKILGIPIYDRDIETAVNQILSYSKSTSISDINRCISATSAHGIIEAQFDEELRNILQSFYWNLPDGMPNVWVARLKGAKHIQRCYGPAFFKALLMASIKTPHTHFFCGGKEGVAEQLKHTVSGWGNQQLVGTFCPPFRKMTENEWILLGTLINNSGASIVWVGLSTPKQEYFAWKLRQYCSVAYIITVGAAFDFHTGNLRQAPKWLQNIGLEWLFRLFMEPKRLYKRYWKIVPMFIWLNLKEFVDFCIYRKR